MMKIHTTQNLSSPADYRSTNITLPKQIRYTKYSDSAMPSDTICNSDNCDSIAFKGKKSAMNKAVEAGKKSFSERVANMKGIKKLLESDSFSKVAEFAGEQEVMIQSLTALAICCALRPATIMALPGDKNKKDCAYASAHSFSSGVWGFVVPFLFIKPLANGYNNALKNAGKYIEDEARLKEFWPHLDINSIKDANGARKPMSEWLDMSKNIFIPDIKDVRKVPLPKHISEVSEETLKKLIPDLDTSKLKGVSANKWLDKNGNNIKFKLEDMFIAVKDADKDNVKYYPLMHVEENILKEVFPTLDTASIQDSAKKRIHPDQWKNLDGSAFNMDKDTIFLSRWEETDKAITLITGRTNTIGGEVKDVCYQKNNIEGDPYSLGTPIDEKMIEADNVNKVFNKFCGWLPDIVVAYPRATATIAILPFVLKNVFHLEKTKKPKEAPAAKEVSMNIEAKPTGKEAA